MSKMTSHCAGTEQEKKYQKSGGKRKEMGWIVNFFQLISSNYAVNQLVS